MAGVHPGLSLDPRDHNWEKELEKGISGHQLPDCRLSVLEREKVQIVIGRMKWDAVYCGNCHSGPHGATPPSSPFTFFLCDECFLRNGTPPGTVKVG